MAKKPNKDDIRWIVVANVKKYRKRAKLSQEILSERCGFHKSYVGRLERTPGNPELTTLGVLAEKLGVTPADLVSIPQRR